MEIRGTIVWIKILKNRILKKYLIDLISETNHQINMTSDHSVMFETITCSFNDDSNKETLNINKVCQR